MAKTNVKYVNKAYGVNRNEGIVTCTLDYVIDLDKIPGINLLCELDEFNDFINTLIYCEGVKYIDQNVCGALQFRVKEIAFCSTEDEFDEVIGKRLALTRAQKIAFRNTKYFYNEISNIINRYRQELNNLAFNSFISEERCHNHEFELTNSIR
jgi:hypothetical protein